MSTMITMNLHTKDLLYIPNYVLTLEKYFIQNQNNCFDLKISSDYFKLNIDLTDKTYLGFCNFIRNILFKVISKICLDTFKDFYKEPANIETVYKYNQRLTIYIRDLIYENWFFWLWEYRGGTGRGF